MERMSYYCIAKEPWLLDEFDINTDDIPNIDSTCSCDVIYEMLRTLAQGKIGFE